MQELKILNNKEVKTIHEELREHYGYTGKLEFVFLLSEKKQKIYLFNRDMAHIDLAKFRIDTMGLYFGALYEGNIRLSIEGSQMIGAHCTKNVLTIAKEEQQQWLRGEKLTLEEARTQELEGFVIVKYNNDFLGVGKIAGENVLNYIPKTRFVHANYEEQ